MVRAAALVGAAIVTLAVLAPPAALGQPDDSSPAASLRITTLTGVLGPGSRPAADPPPPADGDQPADTPPSEPSPATTGLDDLIVGFAVENRADQPLDKVRVVVELLDEVGFRSQLWAELDDGGTTLGTRFVDEVELRDGAALASGETAMGDVRIPPGQAGYRTQARGPISAVGGVYPLRVSVFRGSRQLDQAVTAVVWLNEQPEYPMVTTVLWPLDTVPWRGPDGAYPPDADRAIRPGGRLDRILAAVESEEGPTRLVLGVGPHLLEDLVDRADGFVEQTSDGGTREVTADAEPAMLAATFLERLQAAARAAVTDPVAPPYADADLAALIATGFEDLADSAVVEGQRRVQQVLDRPIDDGTAWPTSPITRAALDVVGSRQILLGWEDVEGPDLEEDVPQRLPPVVQALRSSAGRQVAAAVADPVVSERLRRPDPDRGAVVAAQRVIAETAMIFFELPEEPDRPLLVLPPVLWDPDGRTAELTARGFAAAPWLELERPAALFATVERRPREGELAVRDGDRLPAVVASNLAETRTQLDALQAALPADDTEARPALSELEDALLRSTSTWLLDREGAAPARRLLQAISREIERGFGEVRVPSGVGITLTSGVGELPVTVRRVEGGPITVRITLRSGVGLQFPEGERSKLVDLPAEGSQTVSFTTTAVSRGTFPVSVVVEDPQGARRLAQASLSVRSTAISGPALIVVGTVVVGLLIGGVVRRQRRPELEVVDS